MKACAILALLLTPFRPLAAQDVSPEDRAAIEKDVMAVLDEYMDAFNSRDVDAWETTFHFPHYRLASGRMNVLDSPGQQNPALFAALARTGWDHSGWGRRDIVQLSASKVHVATTFIRYREDGSVLSRFESLYIMTLEDGRWGVKLRSSFAP
jgi:hypothetical protein